MKRMMNVKQSNMENKEVNEEVNEKRRITPERAMEMLRSEGLDITLEQAKDILDFLRKLANITVTKYLKTRG
ncbi:hypothetical protein D0817_25175 [Flavobacterium cupreum]|uniref:DUF2624 family protein n=3 Tax=Flavobacteriaceae TaxID=49546 RepID=A0A4Y7U3H1_9FLAO|nr:hypothetical protein D0817_25175 [Flavobacterium cupreum]TEB40608.1 hypothetical protein D0809_29745 [Flavobacterium circumlabens]